MIRLIAYCPFLLISLLACQPTEQPATDPTVYSPDRRIRVEVSLDAADSSVSYQVGLKQGDAYVTVVKPSALGLLAEATNGNRLDLSRGFATLAASETASGTEEYTMLTGKRRQHEAAYQEKAYTLTHRNDSLTLRFRVFNDGLGFRYDWSGSSGQSYTIQDELTAFNLPTDGQKWLQAYDSVWMYAPAYETFYQDELPIGESAPANKNGWSFPALFHTANAWLLLSEAALDGTYVGMHLNADPTDGQYRLRFPEPNEAFDSLHTRPEITLPWTSPWRVIHLLDSLDGIVTSELVHHLAKPSTVANTGWIKPGRASWSWWYYSDSPQDYNQLTPYVDFAAEMGWEYSLVDANWNRMQNGDLAKLAAYAKDKGVRLLVWYNSGGPHNVVTEEPRDQMHTAEARREAFARLREFGVARGENRLLPERQAAHHPAVHRHPGGCGRVRTAGELPRLHPAAGLVAHLPAVADDGVGVRGRGLQVRRALPGLRAHAEHHPALHAQRGGADGLHARYPVGVYLPGLNHHRARVGPAGGV